MMPLMLLRSIGGRLSTVSRLTCRMTSLTISSVSGRTGLRRPRLRSLATKKCRGCDVDRDVVTEFYPSRPDRCKPCLLDYQRERRKDSPGHTRKVSREAYRRKRAETRAVYLSTRRCAMCDGPIPHSRAVGSKYCSRSCGCAMEESKRRARVAASRAGRLCANCGEDIPVTRVLSALYCADRCAVAANEVQRHHRMTRRLSHYAIKVGRLLKRPCEVCGNPDVQIHHLDYFEPLNVRFLCFLHHVEVGHGNRIRS